MSGTRIWAAVGVILVAGVGVAGGAGRSAAGPTHRPPAGSLPVDDVTIVCPYGGGIAASPLVMTIASVRRLVLSADAPVTITRTALRGRPTRRATVTANPVARTSTVANGTAVVVHAHGRGAAGVVADEQRLVPAGIARGLLSTPCQTPGTDTWITGADGRVGYVDLLLLSNPGTTVANLTVSAWAATGPLSPPKLQAFTVAARGSTILNLADFAPDKALVALHVHANSGRVTATVIDRRFSGVQPTGIDWISPTRAPARELVVPGFPGAGSRQLVLTNPGTADATVQLRLATTTGNFAPAGHPSVLVRAGHTVNVDLTASFGGAAGAVLLRSDVAVIAAGFTRATATGSATNPDFQWQPATAALTGPAVLPDNTPPFGQTVRLYVTAPRSPARLRVVTASGASRTVDIRGGRTVTFDPEAAFGSTAYGPLVLIPVSGGPVYASRTLYALGAHGPLMTAEVPTTLPTAVPLRPAVEDLRAALR